MSCTERACSVQCVPYEEGVFCTEGVSCTERACSVQCVLYEVGVSCMKTVYSVQRGCVLYRVSCMQRVCSL